MFDIKNFPLLVIRLILGIVLTLHGAQKVFGVFGGSGLESWTNYITGLDMPLINIKYPKWIALLSAWAEFLGGIFILLGIATKLSAIIMTIFLFFAIYIAHWKAGFFIQEGGYEYGLSLMLLCIVLIVNGGGQYELFPLDFMKK